MLFENIQESNKITNTAKAYNSKLKNMHMHLKELLAKRMRLDLEIKTLRKSIEEKQTNYEKSLKVSLQLENGRNISEDEFHLLQESDPYLASALLQLEDTSRAVTETLREIED